MLTPSDPSSFRAEVLRRAVRLERRRRRGRALLGVASAVAVLLSAASLVAATRTDGGSSVTTTASSDGRTLRVHELELDQLTSPYAVIGDGRSTWVLDRGRERGPAVLRYRGEGELAAVGQLPADARPEQIVAGTDGGIWMTDPAAARVLRVAQDGTVTTLPVKATPSAGSVFASERLWFGDQAGGRLISVDANGRLDHRKLPAGASPELVALGPDGSVWYADAGRDGVGSVSPSGSVATYSLAGPTERVLAMSPGPGSALWFLIRSDDGLRTGRVDGAGRIVEEVVEPSSADRGLTPGPDGRLWFTSGSGSFLLRRSIDDLATTELDTPLRASSLALTAENTIWAVDHDRGVVVELR